MADPTAEATAGQTDGVGSRFGDLRPEVFAPRRGAANEMEADA